MGLEPTLRGWKPRVLPLHYVRMSSPSWTRTSSITVNSRAFYFGTIGE